MIPSSELSKLRHRKETENFELQPAYDFRFFLNDYYDLVLCIYLLRIIHFIVPGLKKDELYDFEFLICIPAAQASKYSDTRG